MSVAPVANLFVDTSGWADPLLRNTPDHQRMSVAPGVALAASLPASRSSKAVAMASSSGTVGPVPLEEFRAAMARRRARGRTSAPVLAMAAMAAAQCLAPSAMPPNSRDAARACA